MIERDKDATRELSLSEALSLAKRLNEAKTMSKSEAFDMLHMAEASGHIFAVIGWTIEDARAMLGDYATGRSDEELAEFLKNNRKYIEDAMAGAVHECIDWMWEADHPDADLVKPTPPANPLFPNGQNPVTGEGLPAPEDQ